VEPTGFKIDCITNPLVDPKFILNVQIDDLQYKNVNINISTQFLSVLTKGMNLLQSSQTETNKIEIDEEIDYDLVVKVSPYKIQNLTGYKIIVVREFSESQMALLENVVQDKLIIFNQHKINYQVDSQLSELES
jgi:hypothetical protein